MFKYANCFRKPPSDNSGTFSFIENGDKNGFLNRTAYLNRYQEQDFFANVDVY